MICVTKQNTSGKQLSLYYEELDIVTYGSFQDINNYFLSKDIHTLDLSGVKSSGWDYIVDSNSVYLIIDINYKFIEETPIFFFKGEILGLDKMSSVIRKIIRDDKINYILAKD